MPVTHANSPKSVLSAWIALEVLSPPAFREPEDLIGGDKRAVARITEQGLPWEKGGEPPRPNRQLYYQLILGTVNLEAAMTRLGAIYPESGVESRSLRGRAIVAVVLLDQKGIPVKENAATLSSFSWGLPRALATQLESLNEWPSAEKCLQGELSLRLRKTDDGGVLLPLTLETLTQAYDWLVQALGLPNEVVESPRYALRLYERASLAHPPEPVLLNSFFLNDLVTAAEQFNLDTAPPNLKLFLGSGKPEQRRDLLNDKSSLIAALRPVLFSPARWPGPGRYPLVLLQQAAVNLALEELKDHGILAINGPPGTGKTTLLRDIVAALVTERARVMATFDDPAAAFVDSDHQVQVGPGRFRLYHVDPKLRGFEMLVASSNNKAVENISAELPGMAAIAADAQALRYFKTTSDALQTSGRAHTWGLIAAVLGNLANRHRFKETFWWDKDVGLASYLLAASGMPRTVQHLDPVTGETRERPPKIVSQEDPPAGRDEALQRWRQARVAFRTALARSEALLHKLEDLHSFQNAEQQLSAARQAAEIAQADLRRHLSTRPPWWAGLLYLRRARTWRRDARLAEARVRTTAEMLHQAFKRFEELKSALQDPIEALRARLGTRLVDERFFSRQRTDYQREAPWLDDAAHRARDDVFIAAMALHKAFIDAAAKPLRHNLGALMTAFGGKPTVKADQEAMQADLWASLFLVVPVVSTTFASVERMLGKLPPESLGWLLIDEAGQAPPQAAVAALTKTRRAVIVGDPMQIEPVVTLPAPLTEAICRRFGVDPQKFNAPAASVQTLADEATSCMAAFEGHHGSRTVGVPLLIHRRCAEPMFGLSNAVAYDRLMISARPHKSSSIRTRLGPSHWFDIRGDAQDKWCPQEGQCVIDLLRKLANARIEPDLYVVTPFTLVQDQLRKVILKSGVLDDWVVDPRDWVRQRVGTVHVVQGREAEAVIFVLGAQGPQQAGARNWAGERPNLLNVAVSRAKEALYVVGNRAVWRNAGLFSELDAQMPRSEQDVAQAEVA